MQNISVLCGKPDHDMLYPENTPDAAGIQKRLFALIAAKNPQRSPAQLLCETLHLNKSSVYKRLSGEKMLSLDEYLLLLQTFDIQPGQLDGKAGLNVRFDALDRDIKSCTDFLELVHGNFQAFGRFSDLKIWFVTDDLPLFYHGVFRELSLFKIFSYARLNWELPYTMRLRFHPDTFPERDVFEKYLQPVWRHFASVPTVEFWTDELYDNTAKHINQFLESGMIADAATAAVLFEQLEQLLDLQLKMASEGRKYYSKSEPAAGLELYYNAFSPSNMTTILGQSAWFEGVFAIFDDPNFLFIDDPTFYRYTLRKFSVLQNKCVKISRESEFVRLKFFQNLRTTVSAHKSGE